LVSTLPGQPGEVTGERPDDLGGHDGVAPPIDMEPIGAQQSVLQRRVPQEVDVNATVATAYLLGEPPMPTAMLSPITSRRLHGAPARSAAASPAPRQYVSFASVMYKSIGPSVRGGPVQELGEFLKNARIAKDPASSTGPRSMSGEPADMVLHGRPSATPPRQMHRMVGSVAVNLARHSPVPVTIVP